jgi:hypothetical protein
MDKTKRAPLRGLLGAALPDQPARGRVGISAVRTSGIGKEKAGLASRQKIRAAEAALS